MTSDPTTPDPLMHATRKLDHLHAEVERLTRERDEARKAARWMLPFVALDGAGYGSVHEACQRWPWLEDMEAPE